LVCPANKNKKENFSYISFFIFSVQPGHYFFVFVLDGPAGEKKKGNAVAPEYVAA
jgi:hypothetical protein